MIWLFFVGIYRILTWSSVFRSFSEPSEIPHSKTKLCRAPSPWHGKKMQRWKFRLLTAQSCLRRGVLMMDTADHNLQKDIERCTFFCHFFPKYASRVKSLVLKEISIGFKNFRLRRYFDAIFLVGNHWISATTQSSILGIRVVVQSSSRFVYLQLWSIMIMFFDYIVYKYVCIYIYHTPMIVFMIIFLIMLMVLSIYVHLSYTLRSTLKIYGVYIYIAWVAGFLQNQPPPAPLHGSVGNKNSLIMLATWLPDCDLYLLTIWKT